MTNTPTAPISASAEQKPTSPTNPQQGNQQQTQGDNKPSTDKPASQPQQK